MYKKFEESKPNILEEQIKALDSKVNKDTKAIQEASERLIKSKVANLKEKIFDIEYTLVDFEFEHHRSKNQVGELSNMIKKLYMDIKRGWGAEDTLMEIREYIKKSGIPHFYIEDLNKALELVNSDFSVLTNEIKILSQEKLYKVR